MAPGSTGRIFFKSIVIYDVLVYVGAGWSNCFSNKNYLEIEINSKFLNIVSRIVYTFLPILYCT